MVVVLVVVMLVLLVMVVVVVVVKIESVIDSVSSSWKCLLARDSFFVESYFEVWEF